MKKYLGLIITGLILVLVIALFQIPAVETNAKGELDFQLDGDILVKYIGTAKTVSIPSVVKEIGDGAFAGNDKITKVKIPSSVEKIDYGAFYGCTNLRSVIIPSSVETIETGAFAECTALKSAKIGMGLKNWGEGIFAGDTALTNLKVSVGNNYYHAKNGIVFDKDEKILVEYAAGKNTTDYTIPYGVEQIAPYAFWGCKKLKAISITGMVYEIGPFAFSNCNGLENVYFSPSVKNIDRRAFEDCISLTEVRLPDYVETIHETAFDGCYSLTLYGGASTTGKTFAEEFNKIEYEQQRSLEEIIMEYETEPIGSNTIGERDWESKIIEGATNQEPTTESEEENKDEELGTLLGSTHVIDNQAVVLINPNNR